MDFTTLEQQEMEVTVETNPETTAPIPSSATTTPPPSLDLSDLSSTYTVTTRRHHFPTYLPLLTLLRYSSTIQLAEVVTSSFANAGIQHSAVRKRVTNESY